MTDSDGATSLERPGSFLELRTQARSFDSDIETEMHTLEDTFWSSIPMLTRVATPVGHKIPVLEPSFCQETSEDSLGAAASHDPYQNLSKEIIELIRTQRYEERIKNEEGRRLENEASARRERMRDAARLQELKANVKIMENGIRALYVRSPRALFRMNNGELRTHFLLCEKELQDKLQELEIELLRCTSTTSLLGRTDDIDLGVTRRIVKECRAESELTAKCLKELMQKRQVSPTPPIFSKRCLPSFSGVPHGNNVFEFEKKLVNSLTRMEVLKEDWTYWLLERLSGPAILTLKRLHYNLGKISWDEILETLKLFFGREDYLRDKMILQHQSAGKISVVYDNTNWRKRACRLKYHLSLINESLELSNLAENHHEEVVNSLYVNNLMATLPASDRLTVRERNETWECLSPLERTLAVQKRMKTMLEHALAEQKVSHSADEDLTSGSDSPSDDPDGTDKNPSPSL